MSLHQNLKIGFIYTKQLSESVDIPTNLQIWWLYRFIGGIINEHWRKSILSGVNIYDGYLV